VSLTWNRSVDWSSEDWRDRSACRDVNPTLFFPVGASGYAVNQIDTAKKVCQTCVVRDECLDFALHANQEAGVWGGTSEDERRKLRRQWLAARRRAAVAAATAAQANASAS
jgi:WhiB family redox-sensing transcriptional regulator